MKNLTKKYHIKCFKHLLFARFKTAYLENNSKNNISKKFLITLFLLLSRLATSIPLNKELSEKIAVFEKSLVNTYNWIFLIFQFDVRFHNFKHG